MRLEAGGYTCAVARRVGTSAVATRRRCSTRARMPRRPDTATSRASSQVRAGIGTTTSRTTTTGRGWPTRSIIRSSSPFPAPRAECPPTGNATSTDVPEWLTRRIQAHDPHWAATKRALRAAAIVPVNFAIGSQLIGDAQVATFAAFGSFALLLFAAFPGGRVTRLAAYLALGVAGVALIVLGSLVASPDWLAVVAMAVVAFAVLLAGVVSSVINGGTQAALLSFILAVMLPGGRAYVP